MNLAKLETKTLSEQGVEIELRHPVTDEFLEMYVTILGPDSKTARTLMKRLEDKSRESSRHRRKDEDDDDHSDLFADLIVGWRNIVFDPDKPDATEPYPYSRVNCIRLIRALPWVAGQVSEAFRDRKLFMRA